MCKLRVNQPFLHNGWNTLLIPFNKYCNIIVCVKYWIQQTPSREINIDDLLVSKMQCPNLIDRRFNRNLELETCCLNPMKFNFHQDDHLLGMHSIPYINIFFALFLDDESKCKYTWMQDKGKFYSIVKTFQLIIFCRINWSWGEFCDFDPKLSPGWNGLRNQPLLDTAVMFLWKPTDVVRFYIC